MCGLAGFINLLSRPNLTDELLRACEKLRHRGPDYSGYSLYGEGRIGLAHRRLSIVDLSESGNQPMKSMCGRFSIVFNGEIYNHVQIRTKIEKNSCVTWAGSSDTETLVNAISIFGLKKTLKFCEGMFAFAVWDSKEDKVYLARDRMGEKPLYWAQVGANFYFASELNALSTFSQIPRDLDEQSIQLFLKYSFIPAPLSIYKGVSKLEPGTFLEFDCKSAKNKISKFWSCKDVLEAGADIVTCSYDECLNRLEYLLEEAVSSQMVADVPIGAFLSGGVDSSLIATIMQSHSNTPINTFTVGYEEKSYDETESAQRVARLIGSSHNVIMLKPKDLLEVVPSLSSIYDEPFADSSQIPTYLLSKFAKQKVTVCLTGDGGDELFGGYNRHRFVSAHWQKLKRLPPSLRKHIAAFLLSVSPEAWSNIYNNLPSSLKSSFGLRLAGEKVHKFARSMTHENELDLYKSLLGQSHEIETKYKIDDERLGLENLSEGLSSAQKFMFWDQVFYLSGDILTKTDRASMAASLETRAPFLNHKIVEFSWMMARTEGFVDGNQKFALKSLLAKRLDGQYMDSPKMGFGIPMDNWFRKRIKVLG